MMRWEINIYLKYNVFRKPGAGAAGRRGASRRAWHIFLHAWHAWEVFYVELAPRAAVGRRGERGRNGPDWTVLMHKPKGGWTHGKLSLATDFGDPNVILNKIF